MEINTTALTSPAPTNLRAPEPEPKVQSDSKTVQSAPPSAETQETSTPPPSETVAPIEETTDLNQLLLRNSTQAETDTNETEDTIEPTRDEQRNQLQDRFDAITNDAPTPNIDIST